MIFRFRGGEGASRRLRWLLSLAGLSMAACTLNDPVIPLKPTPPPAKGPVLEHPVQVWWRHSPDEYESTWDYFHPVDSLHEPVLVTQAPRNNAGRFWEPDTQTRVLKPYGQVAVAPPLRQSRFYSPVLSKSVRYHIITMPQPAPADGGGGKSGKNGKAAAGPTQYAIFLGNFTTKNEADMVSTHIWALGYPTIRRELGDEKNKTIFQVQAGPYATLPEAEKAFEHLKKDALKVEGGEEVDGVVVPFSPDAH
ncbi:MAG: SPOR domain-containing protein [Magnetococcales bacterium]|nr:SPOR domain-containing protein [Magnetococcales bacterium]